jgi:hypothetical protein
MSWFDSFNFSSGEGDVAYSDASNVSFGFTDTLADYAYDTPSVGFDGWPVVLNESIGEGAYSFGATPEVYTNDFGVVWDSNFGLTALDTAVKGVGIATQVKSMTQGGVQTATGTGAQSASSGLNGTKAMSGIGDVLSSFGVFLNQVGSVAKAQQATGTGAQRTTAQKTNYTGQLTPTGGLLPQGMSQTTILLIAGGAAVLLALYLHKKG